MTYATMNHTATPPMSPPAPHPGHTVLIMVTASTLIAGCGTLTNALSLSYFIRKENRRLGSRLLMLLNTLDLLVCLSGTVATLVFMHHLKEYQLSNKVFHDETSYLNWLESGDRSLRNYNSFNAVYKFFLQGTGFATSVLSVTRTISLYCPFYRIRGRCIVVVTASFLFFDAVKYTISCTNMYYYYDHTAVYTGLRTFTFTLMALAVVTSNTVSVVVLLNIKYGVAEINKRRMKENRDATVTVLILSALFCLLNSICIVSSWCAVISFISSNADHCPIPHILDKLSYFLAVPLTSAVNPAVYFARKRAMRTYAGSCTGVYFARKRAMRQYAGSCIGSTGHVAVETQEVTMATRVMPSPMVTRGVLA